MRQRSGNTLRKTDAVTTSSTGKAFAANELSLGESNATWKSDDIIGQMIPCYCEAQTEMGLRDRYVVQDQTQGSVSMGCEAHGWVLLFRYATDRAPSYFVSGPTVSTHHEGADLSRCSDQGLHH